MFVSRKRYKKLEERVQELEHELRRVQRDQEYVLGISRNLNGVAVTSESVPLREVVSNIVKHLGLRVKRTPAQGPVVELIPEQGDKG